MMDESFDSFSPTELLASPRRKLSIVSSTRHVPHLYSSHRDLDASFESMHNSVSTPLGLSSSPQGSPRSGKTAIDSLTKKKQQYTMSTTEKLDRENTHFSVCEATIYALEETRHVLFKVQEGIDSEAWQAAFLASSEVRTLLQSANPFLSLPVQKSFPSKPKPRPQTRAFRTPASPQPDRKKLPASGHRRVRSEGTPFMIGSPSRYLVESDQLGYTHSVDDAAGADADADDDDVSMSDVDAQRDMLAKTTTDSWEMIPSNFDLHSDAMSLSAGSVAKSLFLSVPQSQLETSSMINSGALDWIVQGDDTPQAALPISLADIQHGTGDRARSTMHLRGSKDWAPPRNQIIFHAQKTPSSKAKAIEEQGYRCAGCGQRVELNYVKKFRFDRYLGKYFCTSCHANEERMIPGRVVQLWDFSKHRVSDFSAKLLDSIYFDPLFDMMDLNPTLVKKNRLLATAHKLRFQLKILFQYIRICRGGTAIEERMQQYTHLAENLDLYSLNDLVHLRYGKLIKTLTKLVGECMEHVFSCRLCQQHGHVCEICNDSDDVIFGFQLYKTVTCPDCHAVHHLNCRKNADGCPKCIRKEKYLAEKRRKAQESRA